MLTLIFWCVAPIDSVLDPKRELLSVNKPLQALPLPFVVSKPKSRPIPQARRTVKREDHQSLVMLNSMAFGNKKNKRSSAFGSSSGKKHTGGLFKKSKSQSSPLPTTSRRKRGLFSGMTSSKKKRNNVF